MKGKIGLLGLFSSGYGTATNGTSDDGTEMPVDIGFEQATLFDLQQESILNRTHTFFNETTLNEQFEEYERHPNGTFKSGSFRSYFEEKYSWNLQMGREICPPTTNFNDETDQIMTYSGFYMGDEGVGSNPIDYAKCIYVINNWYEKHSHTNLDCQKHIIQIGSKGPIKGTLVSIHSTNQNQAIWDYAKSLDDTNTGAPYWIGIRRDCLGPDCGFEWPDFSNIDYTNWSPGEPNNAGDGEQCGQMVMWSGQWNDDGCSKLMQSVCQVYMDDMHERPTGDEKWPTSGDCKSGWTKYAKGCYRIYGDVKSDPQFEQGTGWNNANQKCAQAWPGATLAILPNIHYQYFATSRLRNTGRTVWIGAQSTMQDSTFHWVDGSRLTYTNWMPNEPNDAGDSGEDFVEMIWWADHVGNTHDPGQWNDLPDDRNLAYMCSHPLDRNEAPPTNTFCPNGWLEGAGGFCYKMVTGQDDGFDNAEQKCLDIGMKETGKETHLTSVLDIYEANLVAALFYNAETNYNPEDVHSYAWIGMYGYKQSGTNNVRWTNTDGMPSAYSRWAKGEPNVNSIQTEPSKSCVYMDQAMNMKVDSTCRNKIQFVCKANMMDKQPVEKDNRGDLLDCPTFYGNGWHNSNNEPGHGHHCFKTFTDKVGWYEAEYRCVGQFGGHLVSIHSEQFDELVHSVAMQEVNTLKYWIGLSRNSAGGLIWSDGSVLSYQNWAPNEPTVDDPDCETGELDCTEDCVEVYDTGMWNDLICSPKRPYVCKVMRPQSNCVALAELDKDPCGFPGITQYQCSQDFNCCYNAMSAIPCYKPTAKKGSMSPGTAAGIACAVWIPIGLLLVLYFVKLR